MDLSNLSKNLLSDDELEDVLGGVSYMNLKLDKLKDKFTKACKRRNQKEIMMIAGELQARGCYGWAKETAAIYGITYL